jgi:hypothetical protein
MTAAPLSIAGGSPPKLLLDTNVFRDLAEGKLAAYEERLLEVAKHRSPPLLWACPIVFEEIACHIRAKEADQFEHFRDALRWMDKLCSNLGMAEDLPWVLRRGVFEREIPYDGALSTAVNQIRREVITLERFTDVPAGLLEIINKTRVQARERLDAWAVRRKAIQEAARSKPQPGERGVDGAGVDDLRRLFPSDRPALVLFDPLHLETDVGPPRRLRLEHRDVQLVQPARPLPQELALQCATGAEALETNVHEVSDAEGSPAEEALRTWRQKSDTGHEDTAIGGFPPPRQPKEAPLAGRRAGRSRPPTTLEPSWLLALRRPA